MSVTAEAGDKTDWAAMDVEVLVGMQKKLMQGIGEQVEQLLSLAPVLKTKLQQELGVEAELSYVAVVASLDRLVAASAGRKPARGAGRRRAVGRATRYQLVYKDTGSPVLDEAGVPVSFKTQIKILRGPKYENLLGKSGIQNVQLVDTAADNQVVVSKLTLGPAPGGRRKG